MIDDHSGGVKPRSLVFDLLGDDVRHHGGEIRLRALVAIAEELGVDGPTIRVVAAQLRDEGWLEVRREGRESVYTLTPKLLSTLDVGARRLFRSEVRPWDGRWSIRAPGAGHLDLPARPARARRHRLRGAPERPPRPAHHPLVRSGVGPGAGRAVLGLGLHNREYQEFIRTQRRNLARYEQGHLDGVTAQAERINLLNTYRSFPFRDPELPPELQPAGWVGDQARELFLKVYALLLEPAQRHYDEVVARYTSAS